MDIVEEDQGWLAAAEAAERVEDGLEQRCPIDRRRCWTELGQQERQIAAELVVERLTSADLTRDVVARGDPALDAAVEVRDVRVAEPPQRVGGERRAAT